MMSAQGYNVCYALPLASTEANKRQRLLPSARISPLRLSGRPVRTAHARCGALVDLARDTSVCTNQNVISSMVYRCLSHAIVPTVNAVYDIRGIVAHAHPFGGALLSQHDKNSAVEPPGRWRAGYQAHPMLPTSCPGVTNGGQG